ncbi:hypothetical protein [Nannocystis sp. SCPEA4]|uniref:hypothetical protein n=1 Tax=Nannocystis sp. SCPEA4 TaxID=2996787 RepID=UPI0022717B5C|nr:hypothetical protein [Nannocystis sp. SCPEA4]MCY1060683.1 hypothetical protein [Nannocystis sp. SCPEA4]
MRPVRLCTLGLPLVVAALLPPATARAGNGIHERTPVQWPETTGCMTVIDRSVSPIVHFDYEIPFEDTMVTADEVTDSRRHQFVAFCRNHTPQEPLPVWLAWKDVEIAEAAGIAEKTDYKDDEVLETNAIYKDCFVRVTADEARRPITFAEAAKGFDWDTSALAPGPYILQGYTWEPAFNIWSKRPGVVHVVDGPDLAGVPPAAALMNTEDLLFGEDTLMLQGCARALPGSTMTGYWSLTGQSGLEWNVFAEGVPLEGETIALPFKPPFEAVGQTVALRVDVVDPMQRSFSAFPRALIVILPGNGETTTGEDCSDTNNFIGMMSCGDDSSAGDSSGPGSSDGPEPTGSTGATGSSTGSSTGDTGDAATTTPIDGTSPGACGCHSGGLAGSWAWTGLLLLGLRRRRTRAFAPPRG